MTSLFFLKVMIYSFISIAHMRNLFVTKKGVLTSSIRNYVIEILPSILSRRTWCSSVEFENVTFSCFYHATQITRISLTSLTHTARKSALECAFDYDEYSKHRYAVDIVPFNHKLGLRLTSPSQQKHSSGFFEGIERRGKFQEDPRPFWIRGFMSVRRLAAQIHEKDHGDDHTSIRI